MPFNFSKCDCTPLVIDNEFSIKDEDKLAEYVGSIILGHFYHIKKIIYELSSTPPLNSNDTIEIAISHLKKTNDKEIEKRDGWLFQIISWLVLVIENKKEKFFCQQPHDAPAQHGLDGIAILLNADLTIKNIIITEDKCTENHRVIIPQQIWPEFSGFENGDKNNKLISRISAILENLDNGSILQAIQNDICSKHIRIYRVGINRTDTYDSITKRKNLFKGYDNCVLGNSPHRRYAATIHKDDIRAWMEHFSKKVINYLNSKKTIDV